MCSFHSWWVFEIQWLIDTCRAWHGLTHLSRAQWWHVASDYPKGHTAGSCLPRSLCLGMTLEPVRVTCKKVNEELANSSQRGSVHLHCLPSTQWLGRRWRWETICTNILIKISLDILVCQLFLVPIMTTSDSIFNSKFVEVSSFFSLFQYSSHNINHFLMNYFFFF